MKQECPFCKTRDVGKTIQGLAPDINEMIATHTIPESSSEVVYNQLEELADVGVRISDDFDMLMIMRGLDSLKGKGVNLVNGSSQGPLGVETNAAPAASE